TPLFLRWVIARVSPGKSGLVSFQVGLAPGLPTGTVLTNRASATQSADGTLYLTEQPATNVNGVSLAAGAIARPINSIGQWLTIAFTVTNTGGVSVSGITATVFAGPGAGLAAFVSGPLPPGPVTLAAGSATTFV